MSQSQQLEFAKTSQFSRRTALKWLGSAGLASLASAKALNSLNVFGQTATREIWINNQTDNTISVLDASTLKPISAIALTGQGPHNIAFTPDGLLAFTSNVKSNDVSVVDTVAKKEVDRLKAGARAHGLALLSERKELWVTNTDADNIFIYSLESFRQVGEIRTKAKPVNAYFTPDRTLALITHADAVVLIVGLVRREVVGQITTGENSMGLAYSPDGSHAYLANAATKSVAIIDTITRKVASEIPVGMEPHDLIASPDTKFLYTTVRGEDRIAIIDRLAQKVVAYVQTGKRPDMLALGPDSKKLWVTHRNDNEVGVIDLETRKLVQTITTGKEPHGVALRPA
jgi:YVTN family beta-propeller protein